MANEHRTVAPHESTSLTAQHPRRPVSISARLGKLQFHKSGKFRVLQFTDIQDGPKVSADTIRLIAASCDAARPDLVIFTGDQIAGYDSGFMATFRKRRWATAWDGVYATSRAVGKGVNAAFKGLVQGQEATPADSRSAPEDPYARTRDLVRKQAAQFLAPVIERGIPFAVTYGNHDFQCGLETAELDAIYREFPGCLNPEVSGADSLRPKHIPASGLPQQEAYACEPGTFALPVSAAPGEVGGRAAHGDGPVIGIVIADSGDYAKQGGYGTPSPEAIEWIGQIPARLGTQSILFQHIPLPQFYKLLRPVPATTAYAIQGYRTYDKQCYVLDESMTEPGGYLGEGVSCPDIDPGEFAAMRASGGYFAAFAGHDHRNAFVGTHEGMLLGATPTCGFGSYGPPAPRRAARMFEFDIRHPFNPRTQLLEFGEIVGRPSSRAVYTFAMSHLPKGPKDATNLLRKPGVLASAAATLTGIGALIAGSRGRKKE